MEKDLVIIAQKVAEHFAQELNRPFEGFTDAAVDKLISHEWPGNVRELRNVLERALIFARTPTLDASDLVLLKTEGFEPESSEGYFRFRSGGALEELEYEYIKHILSTRNTSYADAAKLLGISKKTLWEKRKKYNLDEEVEELTS